MKVVYNACYGGYSLSRKAKLRLVELGHAIPHPGKEIHWEIGNLKNSDSNDVAINDSSFRAIPRHDPRLVQVVEELGERANGDHANLRITEVDGRYRIDEYDGNESVETPDSYEWVTP